MYFRTQSDAATIYDHILTLIGLILTGFQVFSGSILYG
jgi:hypothetical protein